MRDAESIAKGLHLIMNKYKVNQHELNEIAGVSYSTMNNWANARNNGSRRSGEELNRIAEHFGEPAAIFDRPETNEEQAAEYYKSLINNLEIYYSEVDDLNASDGELKKLHVLWPKQEQAIEAIAYLSSIGSLDFLDDQESAKSDKNNALNFFRKLEYFNFLSSQIYSFVSNHSLNELEHETFIFSLHHEPEFGNYTLLDTYCMDKQPVRTFQNSIFERQRKETREKLDALYELGFMPETSQKSMQISIDEEPEKEKK